MIKRVSLSEQIRQSIIDYIRQNNLQPGDKLPTEKEFSELFQASRTSVREAIKSLSLNGTLKTMQGKGTFLLPAAAALTEPEETNPINELKMKTETRISDITEIRVPLEITAVKLAARRASPEQLEELRMCCEQYRIAAENGQPTAEWGCRFHTLISEMSGNPLLIDAINAIIEKMSRFRGVLSDTHREQEFTCTQETIYRALAAGDERTAAEEMIHHIMVSNEALLSLVHEDYREILLND